MLRWLRGGVASRAALRLLLSSVFGSLSLFGVLSLSPPFGCLSLFFFLRFSLLFIGAEPWGTIGCNGWSANI